MQDAKLFTGRDAKPCQGAGRNCLNITIHKSPFEGKSASMDDVISEASQYLKYNV
jgi:hypothetical protein